MQFEMTGCYQTPILHYMKKPSAETTPDSHLNGTKRTKEREGGGVATGEATLVAKDDLLSSSHAQPSTPSHRSMIRGGRLQCCKSRCRQSRIKGQRMRNANFPPLGMPPSSSRRDIRRILAKLSSGGNICCRFRPAWRLQ